MQAGCVCNGGHHDDDMVRSEAQRSLSPSLLAGLHHALLSCSSCPPRKMPFLHGVTAVLLRKKKKIPIKDVIVVRGEAMIQALAVANEVADQC